jgi:DNA-binding transcriptional MerR regulator
MTQWYVKGLSEITQISVQTLHHYDRIDLLKPSIRLPNGYRVYSEKDLLKLQQIISLKFFGFELSQIKTLLSEEVDLLDHLSEQSLYLENKAKTLLEASNTLKGIISGCNQNKSIPWETIIKSIEVYIMIQQLEKTWAGKVFNAEELKLYANFEKEMQEQHSEEELQAIEQKWGSIITEANANLDKDPTSDAGFQIGKRCMDFVNSVYGPKYTKMRNALWENGLGKGLVDTRNKMSPECFAWLDKAIETYYKNLIVNVLSKMETNPREIVLNEWNELITYIYGDDHARGIELYHFLLNDENVDEKTKNWLKEIYK